MNPRTLSLWLPLSLSAAIFSLSTPCYAQIMFMGLGDLPGGASFSKAHGMSESLFVNSADYVVVGESDSGEDGPEAFRWTASEGMVGLDDLPLGGFDSRAFAVTADGSTIVGRGTSDSGFEPVIWTSDSDIIGLGHAGYGGDPGSQPLVGGALGISDDGTVVVGNAVADPLGSGHGFQWNPGEDAIPDTGDDEFEFFPVVNTITAVSADGSVFVGANGYPLWCNLSLEASRWSPALERLGGLDGFCSRAHDVSPDGGTVVGVSYTGSDDESFRWTSAGGMVRIESIQSAPLSVSAGGSTIVGTRGYDWDGSEKAFIWDQTNGMRDLAEVLTDLGLDLTGWTLIEATGVSRDGTVIVGWGTNPNGDTEAWIAVIPEPGTLAAVASLVVMLLVRRRTT
jgi:uncharacterized membrane protein